MGIGRLEDWKLQCRLLMLLMLSCFLVNGKIKFLSQRNNRYSKNYKKVL